jgi:hypothetical protein
MNYLSLDTSKSLKDQIYGDPAIGGYETSYLGEFEGTWYDYIMSLAKSSANQVLVFCEEANARGITLDDADKAQIEIQLTTLEVTANAAGYTMKQYINMMYGKGVSEKDIRKCLELTALASKGMTALQEELINNITDADITDKYNSAKDNFDLVDYVYFAMSAKYDDVAKSILGSDYTQDELSAKKAEVDAEYNKQVEDAKTVMAALEKITDKDEFIKYVITHNAENYYDTSYKSFSAVEPNAPEASVLEIIKKTTIEKVVAEVLEGKTEATKDVVESGDSYTLYEQSVKKEFAEVMVTIKNDIFKKLVTDLDTYKVTKSVYSENSDVSKWAFDAARKVGDIKNITNDDKPEESYSSAVYMLTKTRYADQTKTKNIAYMLFSKKEDAQKAIDSIKAITDLNREKFDTVASEANATTFSTIEEYVEGSLGVQAFDDWAYSDTIKLGDYTTSPIELEAGATYLVGYYYEEAGEAWKVSVKGELFNERYNKASEDITAKFAVTTNDKALNKISDGYLPAGLAHAHNSTSTH